MHVLYFQPIGFRLEIAAFNGTQDHWYLAIIRRI